MKNPRRTTQNQQRRKHPKSKPSNKRDSGKLTYSIHRETWKDCRDCELCNARRKVVLYRGFIPCDVLFIGEAPGASEDVIGRPFVGPAGQLLDAQINEALELEEGQDWADNPTPAAYRLGMTNLLACIPREIEEDEETGKIRLGEKVNAPKDKWVKPCSPRLEEIYKLARPKKVVCVGVSVAEKKVPKILPVKVEDTIAIRHPANILRMSTASQGLEYQRVVVQLEDLFYEMENQDEN